jgi:hypothetical protein
MQASIGQYSMHAGEPAHPVQQSVVMARMRGLFFRAALPSPSDIGQCFSTMSYIKVILRIELLKIEDCRLLIVDLVDLLNLGCPNRKSTIYNLQ